MLSPQKVEAKLFEVSENLESLGYEIRDVVGPNNKAGESIDPEEVENIKDMEVVYYLSCELQQAEFYIAFSTNRKTASIIYPMDVLAYLGSRLSENEVESVVDEQINWENLSSENEREYRVSASKTIVEQTDPEDYAYPAYNLSAYASTSLIDYRQTTTKDGFPTEYQCLRLMFPYTEQITMKSVEDRIMPVIVAGNRGKRYMDYSFRFETENRDPEEYKFKAVI